jgi:hypothetical protein
MEDQQVDLTGVHPVRRAETLRRIAVVKSFVALGRSTRADADHHAGLLGIGYNQFFLLVRAWLEHGRASALPGAKKRLGLVHEHQLRRLDLAIERIISDVIEEKGAFARLTRVIAAVRERCEKEGLAPPTGKAVRPRLEEARRTAVVTNADGGTIVIGRALTDVPVLVREGLMEPALLLLSIHVQTRRVASPRRSVENIEVIPLTESGSKFRTYDWSSGFEMRRHRKVPHWESIVLESSLGRWLITVRLMPYLRPSFAMRSADFLAASVAGSPSDR